MKIHTNCSIEKHLKEEAIRLGLSFSECLEFGILFKRAEKQDLDYPINLVSLKLERATERLNQALSHNEEPDTPKSAEKIFSEGLEPNMYPGDYYGN